MSRLIPYLILFVIIACVYYKFIFFGKIPFPGDLLVASYSPWFDYYKIPVQNPLISDVFSQFFLWKYLSLDSFKQLQWPLWNPYSFTGTPLLATYHSATLYPLNLLLFLPKYFGWGIFIFSQTPLAAINMYLLLTLWTKSKLSQFIGAVIFAFSGLMTTWLELGTAVHAMAWLPLAFFAIERYLSNLNLRYLLLLIFSLVMILLAGNAQISTYSFLIVLTYSVINIKKLVVFPSVVFSMIIAVFICTPQLLPSFDLLKKSIRLTETYVQDANFGLLPIKEWLKFFIADFFGNPITRNYWGFLNYSETSSFLGSFSLPLLIFSYLYLKRNRVSKFFLILLPFSLILSFDNPLSKAFYQFNIPILTSSYASRVLFITSFTSSILCALSLNQLLGSESQLNKFFKSTIWSWASLLGALLGSLFLYKTIQEILKTTSQKQYLEVYLRDTEYALTNFVVSTRNTIIPVVFLSIFLIFFILVKLLRSKLSNKYQLVLVGAVLFSLTTLDLGRYFLKFNPFVTSQLIFPTTPTIEYLKAQPGIFRVGREHAEVFPPNTWIAYDLQSLEGYDPLYLNQFGKFIHFLNGGDIRIGSTNRYAELSATYDSPFIDIANVKYFIGIGRDRNAVTGGEFTHHLFNKAGYKKIYQDGSSIIVENPNALKRAYFASSYLIGSISKIEDVIMTDTKFNPRITAALSRDLQLDKITGTGSALISEYSSNRVKIKTETENEELLILADQYEEGWKAKIDNQETLISPANLIFRAIKIPAGKHEIIFWYWPKSFDLGLKISLATLLVLFLISLVAIKLKRF